MGRRVTVCPGCSRYGSHVVPFLGPERLDTLGFRTLWKGSGEGKSPLAGGLGEAETNEEEDEDVEELLLSQAPALFGAQRIFIVHPDVKWGAKKPHDTTGNNINDH